MFLKQSLLFPMQPPPKRTKKYSESGYVEVTLKKVKFVCRPKLEC